MFFGFGILGSNLWGTALNLRFRWSLAIIYHGQHGRFGRYGSDL